ncbi:MAG: S-adenosylmethionine:tRNA ribosyltransferase-isomerase, partial [Microvirga sp.]
MSEFDFDLPEASIAQHPPAARDHSRLLVLPRTEGDATHASFGDLVRLLRADDLLVVNRSRVRKARLLGRRSNGGAAEVLVMGPDPQGQWTALVRPGKKLRPGDRVQIAPGASVRIDSESIPPDGRRQVSFPEWSADPEDLFDRHGHVPLPPYVRRPDDRADT